MLRLQLFPVYAIILLTFFGAPQEAWAYIDPGSGSILLQVLLFAFASIFVFFRTLGGRVRQFFRRDVDKNVNEDSESSVFDEEDEEE